MKYLKSLSLIAVIVLIVGCGPNTKFQSLEKEMSEKGATYYEEFLIGKTVGINRHQISLEAMENNGYDISNFIELECDKDSYVLVSLELDDAGLAVGDYEIENHLTCKNYQTEAN